MRTMNIAIARIPRTLRMGNTTLPFEELGVALLFARKPSSLDQLSGSGDVMRVYVTETRTMSPSEFDLFACSLQTSRDWLRGKGGATRDAYFCIEVTAPGRPYLYVNPEGGDYARYVARLG